MKQLLYKLILNSKLATLLVLLLGGCAGQVNMLPTLSTQTSLTVDQGVVVVRIINASSYPLPFNYLTIAPENLNESEKVKLDRLESLAPKRDGSTVFSAPVNAGNYALSSLHAYYVRGEYWYSRWVISDAKFGTFVVKPGQVTDLGTIIYYPKPQDDKYLDTLLRLPEPEIGEVLDKYFSFYNYDKNSILSWTADEREEERLSLFASVAQNPITYNARYLAPDNSMYFLGKLGVIIKRTATENWELDAVETNFDLNTIAQNERGDLIVGGSEGQLFWKTAGNTWQDISLEHNNHIEKLLFHDDDTIDMLVRKATELTILRAHTSQKQLNWQELNKFSTMSQWHNMETPTILKKSSKKIVKQIFGARLSEIGQTHYITVSTQSLDNSSVFFDGSTQIFAYDPDTWKVRIPEQKPDISILVPAGAIKIGIKEAGFWSWSGRTTYKKYINSLDHWEDISTFAYKCKDKEISYSDKCKTKTSKKHYFNFRSIPWFKNDLEGIAVVSFSDYSFWSGKSSYETKILSTVDGGKSWEDTGNSLPVKYCSAVVPELADRLLLSCDGVTGDFYESLDNGANWEHVRQHENF